MIGVLFLYRFYVYLIIIIQMSCFTAFDSMCKRIVNPTKQPHLNQKDLLQRKFRKQLPTFQLFTVTNKYQQNLSCIAFPNNFQALTTILYLHGNGGHKMQAVQILNSSINLVAFDFGGCGKSEGQYLTYGQKQIEDIHCVVQQIKQRYNIKKVSLWGRSMGASLAMMYSSLHSRNVTTMVLDTPFRSLKQVSPILKQIIKNVARYNNKQMPQFLLNLGLYFITQKIQDITHQQIFEIDYMMHLNILNMPIIFIYSTADVVVHQENVKELYNSYKGTKDIIAMECLHHQDRPKFIIEKALEFITLEEGCRSTRSSLSNFSKKGIGMSIRNNQSM